jgi:hypothetical protein
MSIMTLQLTPQNDLSLRRLRFNYAPRHSFLRPSTGQIRLRLLQNDTNFFGFSKTLGLPDSKWARPSYCKSVKAIIHTLPDGGNALRTSLATVSTSPGHLRVYVENWSRSKPCFKSTFLNLVVAFRVSSVVVGKSNRTISHMEHKPPPFWANPIHKDIGYGPDKVEDLLPSPTRALN